MGHFPVIVYSLIFGDVDKEKDNYGDTWGHMKMNLVLYEGPHNPI